MYELVISSHILLRPYHVMYQGPECFSILYIPGNVIEEVDRKKTDQDCHIMVVEAKHCTHSPMPPVNTGDMIAKS